MCTRAQHYLEAVEHLPDDAVLILHGVTWEERDEKGSEPDVCFYATNVDAIIGKDEVDPDLDPLPDVVVEVDISCHSPLKFEIYRSFGIPEIWRYDGKRMRFYGLAEDKYIEVSNSAFFPGLTATILSDFAQPSRTQGGTQALAAFRDWLER